MCAPRALRTSPSQLPLSTETLLRKCKEFYKIVTLTSQSLWTLVSPSLSCSFTEDQVSLWLNLCQGTRTTDWLLRLLKSQMHRVGKEWAKNKTKNPQVCAHGRHQQSITELSWRARAHPPNLGEGSRQPLLINLRGPLSLVILIWSSPFP